MTKIDLSEWMDWIDGQDVLTKLHISPRTLQGWRTNGFLPFSQMKGKYYYRKSDILRILKANYNGRNGQTEANGGKRKQTAAIVTEKNRRGDYFPTLFPDKA